ncbi:MAG: hypothetical protein QOE90_137 [Thermoplasmata archaeon]|jgi:hypothetical protein|nr:hypothetical protein [Thermoplasmata archaeon]
MKPREGIGPRMRLVLALVAVALFALLGCVSPAATPAPAAPPAGGAAQDPHANLWLLDGARPALDSRVSQGGAEPAILVDALGRSILVGDNAGVHVSTDHGATWTKVWVPFVPGATNNLPSTPVVTVGVGNTGISDGWVFAQDADGAIYASTTDGALINVGRSLDGGLTWDATPSTIATDAGPVADRPWLAAHGHGQVAVIWNVGGTDEACSFSSDGGTTFPHKTIPTSGTSGNGVPIGGRAEFDPQGRLYYFGNGGGTLYRYDQAPCGNLLSKLDIPAHGAQLSLQATTDDTGHVYTAVPSAGNGAMQVWGWNGTRGATLKTLTISDPSLQENTYGTIHQQGGEIVAAWYGSSTAGDFLGPSFHGEWNVYVAQVRNFWTATPSVTVTRVSTEPNHVGGFCFGGTSCDTGQTSGDRDLLDYFQVTHDAQGNAHVAYAHDGATSSVEVRYAMVPGTSP